MARRNLIRSALACAMTSLLFTSGALAQESGPQPPPAGIPVESAPDLAVGDCWQYRNLNITQGPQETVRCVVQVAEDGYIMKTDGRVKGLARYNRNLVWLGSIGADRVLRSPARSAVPSRLSFPLWLGKRWTDDYRALDESLGGFYRFVNLYAVEALEEVEVPAGRFVAYRIHRQRVNTATEKVVEGYTWYAPTVRNLIRIRNAWPGGTNLALSAFKLKGEKSSPPPPPRAKPGGKNMRLSHILVPDLETAQQVLRRLQKGESFEALARKFSTDPSKHLGGDLGCFEPGTIMPEIEAALRKLKVGEVGGPVKTERGYHVILRTR